MNGWQFRFLEPLDVLFLRGNKHFGDAGSFGESLMPPWPSLAAGALRSRMLADARIPFRHFADGSRPHPELGTPAQPGPFTIALFTLARRHTDKRVEMLVAAPADLVFTGGKPRPIRPAHRSSRPLAPLQCSYCLPELPVLAQEKPAKAEAGFWLTETGWKKYLAGELPFQEGEDFVHQRQLWDLDLRVGVGLSLETRSAAEGRLFSSQAVAFSKRESPRQDNPPCDVGFLVAVTGAGSVPASVLLRLGGDGRGAVLHLLPPDYALPEPDYEKIAASRRCRVILASPGIFEQGWLPAGCAQENGSWRFDLHGVSGRLRSAVVPRAEVVSGWDLAQEAPKPARRVAPAGSVYWLDELEARPEDLRRLVHYGLWSQPDMPDPRRAEGFNRLWIAEWTKD